MSLIPHGHKIPILSKPFSPKDIPGLVLWMLADDLAGADGDAIVTWTSHEGNARAFTGAATKQPLLKKGANGINGRNVVRFDGNNDILIGSNFNSDTQGTVFAVLRLNGVIKDLQVLLGSGDEAGAAQSYIALRPYNDAAITPAPKMSIAQKNSDTSDFVYGSSTVTTGANYLMMWQSSGTAYFFRLNGTAQTLTAGTGANTGDWLGDTANRDNITIGGVKWNAEAQWLRGDVAEIIWYNTALSASDISRVERYLAGRYSITINP